MQHYQFECIGLDGYADIQEEIHSLLYRSFFYYDYPFMQAVEEAVVNAAQHAADACSARILIAMRVMARNIAVTVACQTKVFDAIALQQKLKRLVNDPVTKDMDWGTYIRQTEAAAGIWYMLTGSEYLCMDAHGQSVTIVTRREQPIQIDPPETRIGLLAPRFLVQQDGVIFS